MILIRRLQSWLVCRNLKVRLFLVFFSFFYFALYVVNQNQTERSKQSKSVARLSSNISRIQTNRSTKLKKIESEQPIILFWTTFIGGDPSTLFPISADCPFKCVFTTDQSYGHKADVRVFHPSEFTSVFPPNNSKALNVHLNFESPINMMVNELYCSDYFNITISYRSTATIFFPYNQAVERDGTETAKEVWTFEQVNKAVEKKKMKVLVLISNCFLGQSARTEYVDALAEHIDITRVGDCYGNKVDDKTLKKLIRAHYFVLAFENSVCPEYTTEKYWRFKDLIVPVVLSRGAMSPNVVDGTFIAASDFELPQKLAAYLNSLIDNPTEYKKYFEWTKKFRRTMLGDEEIPSRRFSNAGCQLCRSATLKQTHRTVDIPNYWSPKECIKNYALGLLGQTDRFKRAEARIGELVRRTGRRRLAHGNQLDLEL